MGRKRHHQKPSAPKAAPTPPAPAKPQVDAMTLFRAQDAAMKAQLTHDTIATTSQKTHDGFENFASRLGVNNDNALSQGTYDFNYVTRNRIKLEAAYRGSWVVGMVVDAVAEDMTRAGITVQTTADEKDVKKFGSMMSRLQIAQSIASLIKWGRLYGGAIGVMQLKGQKLDTPLDLTTVAQDQFLGLVVFDRWQLNPLLSETIKEGPEMGLPMYYEIVNTPNESAEPQNGAGQVRTQTSPGGVGGGGMRVHHTRVIRYIGIELPYFQATVEQMWGESVLERLWDRLIAFDNATMSSASLIDRANLRTVGIDGLREIVGAGGAAQAGLLAQFEMMRLMQVNEGLTLIDKLDEFSSTAYSFAGLSDMMLQFGQQLAGASGIPLVRLFGQSPAGLSATGESDIRMYYDNINAQQERSLRNGWEVLLKVMWQSTFGKPAPEDLEFEFSPLWQMSALDKATITKTNTETILGAYEAAVTSRERTMEELRDMDSDIFNSITDEEIKEAGEEPPPSEIDLPPGDPAEEKPPGGAPVPALSLVPKAAVGDSVEPRGVIARWLSKFAR